MKTSRIKQALSSVQLFTQRCLMNLEPQVASAAIKANQWQWMKRYRVWEANRKVFLWPENWLEPELRDNKSPFFEDLESELLQSDITDDAAATALVHYLEKLDEVAKLEICGMFYEENELNNEADDVVHVIARTAGARRTYYYRRQEGGMEWTPWEKIDLNIEDNPVLPVVWQGRLFLFWVSVLQEAAEPTPTRNDQVMDLRKVKPSALRDAAGEPKTRVTVTLYWSEYYHGKWQPARTSDVNKPVTLELLSLDEFERGKLNLISAVGGADKRMTELGNSGALYINTEYEAWWWIRTSFKLFNTHSLPIRKEEEIPPAIIDPLKPGRYFSTNSNTLKVGYRDPAASVSDLVEVLSTTAIYQVIEPGHYIQNMGYEGGPFFKFPVFRLTRSQIQNTWEAPFFFQDRRHAFFVKSEMSKVPAGEVLQFGRQWRPIPTFFEPRVLVEPDFIRPPEKVILPSDPIDPGVADPSLLESFLREDPYVYRALGTAGTIQFGDRLIGPGGSMAFAKNTS